MKVLKSNQKELSNLRLLTLLSFFMASIVCGNANASVVAIIDSGTDMLHQDIAPKAWINPIEIPRNDRDEDGNGYQDDVHGWNFAEGNPEVIDYSYLGTLTADIRKFFDIQTKAMMGNATEEDITWLREKIKEEEFIKQISIYGNFMHGTHVGGIAIKESDEAKLLAVKLLPTEVKLPFDSKANKEKGVRMWLLKKGLEVLARTQMSQMAEIGAYVANHKADIANGSFGTGWHQARGIVQTFGKAIIKEITEEQIDEATRHFLDTLVTEGAKFVGAAPNTLFVFAAGNDGLDNDKFPTSPTNIKADNVISVAATIDRSAIAPFSNFGEKLVDVAAPGVGIRSTVPGNQYLRVSGTSQAAPYIAGVAAQIKDTNKNLSPKQIREVIMKTVDFKDFLKGKVASNGLVNETRALKAATLSLSLPLTEAIPMQKVQVQDIETNKNVNSLNLFDNLKDTVLPLPSSFKMSK